MADVTFRVGLGRPLTYQEADDNFRFVEEQAVISADAAEQSLQSSAAAAAAEQTASAAAVSSAANASQSASSEAASAMSANEAKAARDAAIVAQNNAVEVVTGGTGSIPAAPGKLPIADATGTLDSTWFPVGSGANQMPANQNLGASAFMDRIGILTPMLHQPAERRAVWSEFVSNTSLRLCMRGDDGIVRTTTLTLA